MIEMGANKEHKGIEVRGYRTPRGVGLVAVYTPYKILVFLPHTNFLGFISSKNFGIIFPIDRHRELKMG